LNEREAARATSVALVAGALGAVQPKINAVLGERVDSWLLATLVNFAAALLGVVVLLAARPQTRRRIRAIRTWPVPRWTFTAGLGGVFAVASGAISVGTIGVAVFSVAFFAGQIAAGLLVDRLGIGAGEPHPLAAARVLAAGLAVVAVVVSQLGRPVGELAPALVLLVVVAGAGAAVQSAFNGRIAAAVGDPFAPTAVNVSVGGLAIVTLTSVTAISGGIDPPAWPHQWWLYVGGFLGVTIVVSVAASAAALGVFRATVAMLAAQLSAAFVVDWVVEGEPPTVAVLAGAALIVAAVVVAARSPAATGRR
jgi:transporter family-2 protein